MVHPVPAAPTAHPTLPGQGAQDPLQDPPLSLYPGQGLELGAHNPRASLPHTKTNLLHLNELPWDGKRREASRKGRKESLRWGFHPLEGTKDSPRCHLEPGELWDTPNSSDWM